MGVVGIEESVTVQIVAARRYALVVKATQPRERLGELVNICCVSAGDSAELTLPNQALSKIGKQGKVVGTKEPRELQLLAATKLPDFVQSCERGIRLIFLPWVDRVSEVGKVGVGGIRYKDRHKSAHIPKAVIPDAKKAELMPADVEDARAIKFVLLPVSSSGNPLP